MNFIKSYIKEFKKESLLCPLFKFIEAIINLLIPVVVANIIDRGIRYQNTSFINTQIVIILLLGISGYFMAIIAQYFAARSATGIAAAIREDLYKKIQKFEYSDVDKYSEATLINRLTNDVDQIQTGLNIFLRLILRSPLIILGSLLLAFKTSIKSGLIFLVTIPLLFLVIFTIVKRAYPIYTKTQGLKDKILNKTTDSINGARVIRSLGIEKDEIEDYRNLNNSLSRIEKKAANLTAVSNSLTFVIINIGIILLLSSGAKQVNSGTIQTGQVVMLYNFMAQILIELVKLSNLIIQLPKTLSSITRVSEIVDYKVKKDNAKTLLDKNDKIKLEFQNVSLKYKGNKQETLENISFEINEGEMLGIIGPNNSGKTSLINLIPKLYKPTDGKILFNGIESTKLSTKDLREIVSINGKNSKLISGNIQDNIEFSDNNLSNDELNKTISSSLSDDIILNKELGLKAKVEEGGANFSGGQKQRLLLARALARSPKILILDEPTSSLDAKTKKELLANLNKEKEGRITIISSTKVSTIKNCDKILVLDDGKLVGFGTNLDLLQDCSMYRKMYDTQSKKEVIV